MYIYIYIYHWFMKPMLVAALRLRPGRRQEPLPDEPSADQAPSQLQCVVFQHLNMCCYFIQLCIIFRLTN